MSKAAAKQNIKPTDFMHASMPERRIVGQKYIPSLPQLSDTIMDDDELDGAEESSKLRPVNIDALKDFMIKKVNKLVQSGPGPANGQHHGHHKHHGHRQHHVANESQPSSDSVAAPPGAPSTGGRRK